MPVVEGRDWGRARSGISVAEIGVLLFSPPPPSADTLLGSVGGGGTSMEEMRRNIAIDRDQDSRFDTEETPPWTASSPQCKEFSDSISTGGRLLGQSSVSRPRSSGPPSRHGFLWTTNTLTM